MMSELSVRRRAVYLLLQKKYGSKAQLARDLGIFLFSSPHKPKLTFAGCTESESTKIIKHLKENNVLTIPGRSHTSIQLNTSPDGKAKVEKIYFEPSSGIENYVCLLR
jgi:hypothetical protein